MELRDRQDRDYRPDIDGLRAVAVLSVIAFHIDGNLLPGGFVGVDIFFVISGYLITRNILTEMRAGTFSVLEFYRRRVKRIAPAMLIVVAATLTVSQFILLPVEAEDTANSALWSVGSLANVYFWLHTDTSYFAASSNELPFLHLWSLGVEEQFYLIWPLLLLLCFRARGLMAGMMMVAAVSFIAAQTYFAEAPNAVYYLLPTRAGELLGGAMAAVLVVRGHPVPNRTGLGIAGAVLIAGSLVLIDESYVFPGMLAIAPVIGAAFVILSGEGFVARILSARPMVWVGLISYSAYLWHWPLLAFYRYGHDTIPWTVGFAVLVATLTLAWLTYRYVETPCRKSKDGWAKVFAWQYVLPGGAIACACLVAMKLDGYGFRFFTGYRETLAAVQQERRPAYSYPYVCQRQRVTETDASDPRCELGTGTSSAIIWGDSTAAHYVGIIGTFAKEGGFRVRNIETGSCPPIDGDPAGLVEVRRESDCRASLEVERKAVEGYDVVIIGALWDNYGPTFLNRLESTVRRLAKGHRVVLLAKLPEIPGYSPRCREKALAYPGMLCTNAQAPRTSRTSVNEAVKLIAANTGVSYYDATEHVCPEGLCSSLWPGGEPLYFDRSHLTMDTSWKVGERIVKAGGVPAVFRSEYLCRNEAGEGQRK